MSARADLSTLEASGLIEIATLQPELEYLFRHALVQEAAYSSLLRQDRRSLHRAAAETILALHPDRERELAGVVGMHYEQAGDGELAARYLVDAGEHALERFALKESIAFFARGFDLAGPAQFDVRLRAANGAAKAGWTYSEQGADLDRLETALQDADRADPRLVAEAYFWMAFLRRQRGEVPETSLPLKQALDRAAALGEELHDPSAAALPRALVGAFVAFTGRLREGAKEMREALEVVERQSDPLSTAMVSNFLAMTYARLGEFAAAEETIARSQQFANDPIALVDVDIAISAVMLERGDADTARTQAQACSLKAEGLGAYACVVASNVMFGAASLATHDAASAKVPLERGNELCVVTNMAPLQTLLKGLLGSTRAELGDIPQGIQDWDEALKGARAMNDRYSEAQTLWGRARTMMRTPDADLQAALGDLDRAVELFEAMEARPALARTLRDRAQARRRAGFTGDDEDERRSLEIATALGLNDFSAG